MARRSSARLRSQNSSTPKRVSLSHDAAVRTPKTAPVKLSALYENDEMPGAFPNSASPPPRGSQSVTNKQTTTVPVHFDDTTPKHNTPIKPADEEMHPKQHQQSTAKPQDEARWLGFTKMAPHTAPPKHTSKIAVLQGTPTKAPKHSSPKFRFTFGREQSLELSPEAKKLMNEKRQEAVRIRDQMTASGEAEDGLLEAAGRKIATPKSKKGRFSEVHMEQFKKMDSIAGHASSFRADPNRTKPNITPSKSQSGTPQIQSAVQSPARSLKRSPSKAQLDEPDQTSPCDIPRTTSKLNLGQVLMPLSRSTLLNNEDLHFDSQEPSPAKRMKRADTDDATTMHPSSSENCELKAATPQPNKIAHAPASYPDLSTLTSPTQSSLARAPSVKSTKSCRIPAPSLARSSSKAAVQDRDYGSPKPSTPLLARSPSKGSLFTNPDIEKPKAMLSPLLKRSPMKLSSPKKSNDTEEEEDVKKPKQAPLLARSPLKMSVIKNTDSEDAKKASTASSVPLLARSPAKITMPNITEQTESASTSTQALGGGIMDRFNLLRSSPMKSILRSPQRLYSDDPAKVAAGTHFATPPKVGVIKSKVSAATSISKPQAEKHVDFTSSTKARYERAQSETSSTPSKGPSPPVESQIDIEAFPKEAVAAYPRLPSNDDSPIVTPQKRRQTAAPGDFTFTANGRGIVFGQSPNAPASAVNTKSPPTIRHVSAEPRFPPAPAPAPATGSKKRKFEFENERAADEEMTGVTSDKENAGEEDEGRPTKRMKQSEPTPSPTKPATRPATLGVKPKKDAGGAKEKKPATISRARLNALSQPKRRI